MSKFTVQKVQLKASSDENIVDFCKRNSCKPVKVITTQPNGYKAVLFVDLVDPNQGFTILIGNSTYAGETISRSWSIYASKESGLPRISHIAQEVVEWA